MSTDPRPARIYEKLMRVAPELTRTREYAKSRVSGFMDLNIDVLERRLDYQRIALSHYWLHPSGDMIADPDMEIAVHHDKQVAAALAFQGAFAHVAINSAEPEVGDDKASKQLNEFLEIWLDNLFDQAHVLPRGR